MKHDAQINAMPVENQLGDTNKMIDHIGEANEMVNQVPDVGKIAEEYLIKNPPKQKPRDSDGYNEYDIWKAYQAGYNEAKSTLYTEEQVRDAIDRARNYYDGWVETENEIIQSLKQPKQ